MKISESKYETESIYSMISDATHVSSVTIATN